MRPSAALALEDVMTNELDELDELDAAVWARTPRQDLAAEMCVLGAVMQDPQTLDEVSVLLRSADFYRPAHQIVYETITGLAGRSEPHDVIAVTAELANRGLLTKVGGGEYIHELLAAPPVAANGAYYAELVRKASRMRALVATGMQLVQMGSEGDSDRADEYIAQAHQALVTHDEAGTDPPTFSAGLMAMLDRIENGEDTTGRVATPFADLDARVGGFRPGQLITIGARPGIGKSVLATDIARHAALRQGIPVFMASVEMNRDELLQRIVAAESTVLLERLRHGGLRDEEWDRVGKMAARTADAPLLIDDTPGVSTDTLRASLRRMERRSDIGMPGLLVVDYLQLLHSTGKVENRQVEVSNLSRNLKLIAREFSLPVIMLAQLNRGPEARTDKVPQVADLRESGAVEQDSDVVILIHREDAYDKESPRSGEADLIVGKNRNGPTGTVRLVFQGHYSRFADFAAPPTN